MKAINTPLTDDKTLTLIRLVPEDDVFITKVAKDAKPAYFMMVINEMLDTLDEDEREFMFDMCEQLRDDYDKLRGED